MDPKENKSRFCIKCNAKYRYECECPNNKSMKSKRNKSFHSGKRYKGKTAWQLLQVDEVELQQMKEDKSNPKLLKGLT